MLGTMNDDLGSYAKRILDVINTIIPTIVANVNDVKLVWECKREIEILGAPSDPKRHPLERTDVDVSEIAKEACELYKELRNLREESYELTHKISHFLSRSDVEEVVRKYFGESASKALEKAREEPLNRAIVLDVLVPLCHLKDRLPSEETEEKVEAGENTVVYQAFKVYGFYEPSTRTITLYLKCYCDDPYTTRERVAREIAKTLGHELIHHFQHVAPYKRVVLRSANGVTTLQIKTDGRKYDRKQPYLERPQELEAFALQNAVAEALLGKDPSIFVSVADYIIGNCPHRELYKQCSETKIAISPGGEYEAELTAPNDLGKFKEVQYPPI